MRLYICFLIVSYYFRNGEFILKIYIVLINSRENYQKCK